MRRRLIARVVGELGGSALVASRSLDEAASGAPAELVGKKAGQRGIFWGPPGGHFLAGSCGFCGSANGNRKRALSENVKKPAFYAAF